MSAMIAGDNSAASADQHRAADGRSCISSLAPSLQPGPANSSVEETEEGEPPEVNPALAAMLASSSDEDTEPSVMNPALMAMLGGSSDDDTVEAASVNEPLHCRADNIDDFVSRDDQQVGMNPSLLAMLADSDEEAAHNGEAAVD